MKPRIMRSSFGSIQVDDDVYNHDILIRLDGTIIKRKKKLSKKKYGTSHKISLKETEFVFEEGASTLVLGTGQFGRARLVPQAERFLQERGCQILMAPTQRAIELWNNAERPTIGLFHVTC